MGYGEYSGTLYHMRQFEKLMIPQGNCLMARLDGSALMQAPAENPVVRLRMRNIIQSSGLVASTKI